MSELLEELRQELLSSADPVTKTSGQRFFKEAVQLHGVKTATVTAIARKHLKAIRPQGKTSVFALCEQLWQSGYLEESFVACEWSHAFAHDYAPDDFAVFERWVSHYVTNWAACDTLCNHTVGAFIEMYPSCLDCLKTWTSSENRWMRRAAAVSLIVPARHGRFLEDALSICEQLLHDREDLVQKGYGWLLKAASEAHRQEVFHFVMDRRGVMPRTALRYAVEKMPPELRSRAMAR